MLILMRGNHDNPDYFENRLIDYPRMKTIPDYCVIQFSGNNILCIGGAVSIDREYRETQMGLAKLKIERLLTIGRTKFQYMLRRSCLKLKPTDLK